MPGTYVRCSSKLWLFGTYTWTTTGGTVDQSNTKTTRTAVPLPKEKTEVQVDPCNAERIAAGNYRVPQSQSYCQTSTASVPRSLPATATSGSLAATAGCTCTYTRLISSGLIISPLRACASYSGFDPFGCVVSKYCSPLFPASPDRELKKLATGFGVSLRTVRDRSIETPTQGYGGLGEGDRDGGHHRCF